MPATPTTPITARLDTLVDVLFDAACDRPWGEPPTAVAVRGLDADEGEIMFKALAEPPASALLDLDRDPTWEAVGLLAEGRATPLDGETTDGSGHHRVRTVALVDRTGRVAGRVRKADGATVDTAPSGGLIVDALRRLLDLPTNPPPPDTGEFWSTVWLLAVVERAGSRRLSWRAAAALHPAAAFHRGDPGSLHGRLAVAQSRLLTQADWAWVHDLARGHDLPRFLLTRERAARLDTGSFARMVLSSLPPLEDVLADCDALLAPSTAKRVRAAVST
jgi:hypothetical protein